MIGLLPEGVGEILLLLVIVGAVFLVVRSVRRRRAFASASEQAELPDLSTTQRVSARVKRIFRDPAQGVVLVEATVGPQTLFFCATDYPAAQSQWDELMGKTADVALYGLATLEPGGVEAMRDQIKDADKMDLDPNLVTLVHEGQFANDYVIIGRVIDSREDSWGEMPLAVYRTKVFDTDRLTLILEMAVPRSDDGSSTAALAPQSLVHGSARFFGYLAS